MFGDLLDQYMETGQAHSFDSLDERHIAYYVDVPKTDTSIDIILKGHRTMCKDVLSREGAPRRH